MTNSWELQTSSASLESPGTNSNSKLLNQQLDQRNKMNLEDQDQRREDYGTNFGPEPDDEEIKLNREKQIAKHYRGQILDQIKQQESIAKHDKHLFYAFETLVVDAGSALLSEKEARNAKKSIFQKQYYKGVWQHQMQMKSDKKSIVVGAKEK